MIVFVERTSSSAGRKMEQEAIHWAANGTAVVVRDPDKLYLTWLRRFFGNLKYDSFIRKVYRWGFRKSPPNTCDLQHNCHVFSHPYFCRDQLDLLYEMKSTPVIRSRSKMKKAEATKPFEQSQAMRQSAVQAAEITTNSLHTFSNPLRSIADMPQFYLAPQIPNEASTLAQQLLNLHTRALLSNSMLLQSHNDAAFSANALDILRLRLQLNQPLPQPSVEEMLQLLHGQNASNQIPSSVASVEALIRLLRQNPPR
ncbi:hypothetical protein FisN_9Lu100 [Fistulifera solaris]|uniref:HSF-type DNA-binding domain-containing protein n=1 Tax=Fistulifera solaris TaxID=1519565 RepID=A0A1Z5KKH3_FISSO|nr:hypothetical protein FisN_9Lu100 [Fistulifera solaris]|eukprot:GAX26820.1 hypothetical protein FisN_9Lu100 [Fistulifera solaris]